MIWIYICWYWTEVNISIRSLKSCRSLPTIFWGNIFLANTLLILDLLSYSFFPDKLSVTETNINMVLANPKMIPDSFQLDFLTQCLFSPPFGRGLVNVYFWSGEEFFKLASGGADQLSVVRAATVKCEPHKALALTTLRQWESAFVLYYSLRGGAWTWQQFHVVVSDLSFLLRVRWITWNHRLVGLA